MPRYSYEAYDQIGKLTRGEIDALSRQSALDALHAQGRFPLAVREHGGLGGGQSAVPWWQREVFGTTALPLSELSALTREMATLIKADVPLDDTLRLVALQPLLATRTRSLVTGLFNQVREGTALSEALAQSQRVPDYYWRLVQASEASGSLGRVLDELTVLLERSLEVRRQVVSALVYPATLLIAAVVALVFIAAVLLPTIVPLFKDSGGSMPASVQVMVNTRAFLESYWLSVLLCLAAMVVAGKIASQDPRVRLMFAQLSLRLPVVGGLIAERETARFARTLATLTQNGVPMLDAMRITSNVMGNSAYAIGVREIGESLKEGRVLSVPMAASGLFSELAVRLTGIGEQTGQLTQMLMQVATIYEATLQRQLARLMSLVTPILTLAIGALVGGLILSVMNAILSVNDLVFK
jgi:general secretion pathway protein F